MKYWRTNVVLLLLFAFGALMVGRLVFLQIVHEGFYKALAQGQQNIHLFAKGERGTLYVQDKNNNLYTLASNQRIPFAFVSPAEVKNHQETAVKLAEILQLEQDFVFSKLQNQDSLFEVLRKRISQTQVQDIQNLKLPGVYIGEEQVRSYPQEALAAHVTGFTNQDGNGQYGIEEYYNNILDGQEGVKIGAKNPANYLLATFANGSQDGKDIILTLDYNIQSVSESLLGKAHENLGIQGGTIIVMEPRTGKILALANTPTFDPNSYAKVTNIEIFQNPAIQKIHEPGSVFKPITMAAAIDAGAITPETVYQDKGMVKIGGRTIYNYDQRTWGERTMIEVLEYSINTGAVFAERKLGHENFLEYIEKFGIFEPVNVDLAGEVFSRNAEFKKGYEINFATASFGQGIEMTPLQLAKAFSAIANDGVLVSPFVVKGHQNEKNQEQVIQSKTASQVTSMLVNVVQNGFGKAAQIPGYYVAGKTGTAQISWSALGVAKSGYSDKTIQSFVGYTPAFDPKFLIVVKLDNPATKTAEYSAVPLFRELAKYIIDYYQIPPDYQVE